jgi:hypothetical protein
MELLPLYDTLRSPNSRQIITPVNEVREEYSVMHCFPVRYRLFLLSDICVLTVQIIAMQQL